MKIVGEGFTEEVAFKLPVKGRKEIGHLRSCGEEFSKGQVERVQEPNEWKDAKVPGVRLQGHGQLCRHTPVGQPQARLTLTSLLEGMYHLPGRGGKLRNEHSEGMSVVQ